MYYRRIVLIIVFFVFILNETGVGQISQGGRPKTTSVLKSAGISVVEMPAVNNKQLEKQSIKNFNTSPQLKSFNFATTFDVSFTTQNSGEWSVADDGTQVWKLKIYSKGAKSINLIFDKFSLPDGARVFLFNEKESYYLGAFTSFNNKSSGKFAVSPVLGDELTVQYEIPAGYPKTESFEIKAVNHDFVGILKSDDRRPRDKLAGSCNIDVNCEIGSKWKDIKDAVCRLIVNGREICTGTLINNTAQDEKPYIISAAHCYDYWNYAETTIYAFNYESPYCAPLDGDPSNSISGAKMKARFDSLDFALAELSLVPPPEYRPYYAGWDRSGDLPDSSVTIHHPQGDIKKISFDYDAPQIDNFSTGSFTYTTNGFFKIVRWDGGVTEGGSSGGSLFNSKKKIIGTLTGGSATCFNPEKDYFERFDMSWDYKSDITKQLKHWLDPLNTGAEALDGERFYVDQDYCAAITHLNDDDTHRNVPIDDDGQFAGYWGGTNNIGITEFMEHFSGTGNEELQGVSFGVGKLVKQFASNSKITLKIYKGNSFPETEIHTKIIYISDLVEDAMNYIGFTSPVEADADFWVGFELSNMAEQDTFVVYQSLREPDLENYFFYKKDGVWLDFNEASNGMYSMVNVFELVACNVGTISDSSGSYLLEDPLEITIYPNPANDIFTLEAGQDISVDKVSVFNLLGKMVNVQYLNVQQRKVQIDLSGNVPGIYFVKYNNGKNFVTKKVSYVPW